jgi:hypothetical protein
VSLRRLQDLPDHDAARDMPVQAVPAPAEGVTRMLALQQSAGNAAVARMLAAPSQIVAREDGYTVEAPSDADFTDSLEDSASESESESESESAVDPEVQLATALAAKTAETGSPGQRPAIDDTGGYTASGPGTDDALLSDSESESESESTSSETSSEDASESLSEDAPVSDRVLEVAAVVAADDASAFSELSEDAASELSSDLSSVASESESAEVSGDEAASSSSSSSRVSGPAAPAQAPVAPPLPVAAAAAPPVKKSAAKRALKALAKPVRALKKIFKGKKKKDLPTAAQLLADNDTDTAAPTTSSTSSSTSTGASASVSKSKVKRARRKSRSEHSDALSAVMSASTPSASTSLSTDEESLSTYMPPAAPPGPDPNRAAPVKYATKASLIGDWEEQDSATFISDIMGKGKFALLMDMVRFDLIKTTSKDPVVPDTADVQAAVRDLPRMTEGLKKCWGWSDEDVDKYFVLRGHRVKDTKVQFIRNEEDLKKYVVHAGASMTYGDPPQVFDTGNMISKASGAGFAIFVMDEDGNIYAGQHRVGLFHHSSFTAGRPVAAAGELKVSGGKLVQLTAKSGHYQPTPENTWNVVKQMAALGVSFAGTEIKVWIDVPGQADTTTNIHDGEEFLRLGGQAPVKRTGGKF